MEAFRIDEKYLSQIPALQVLVNIPLALMGGLAFTWLKLDTISIATLVGFIAVGGVAARNGIMMISHYLHLMQHEGEGFTRAMVVRGTLERLVPVAMTALSAGIGLIPWGPLGAGFLTGKYSRDTDPPEGSRMAEAGDEIEEARHRRAIERNFAVVDEAEAIAAERGATISQVALAWLLGEPGVVAPIVGPRTFEQLEDLLGAADLRLSDEERERLAAPAPPPVMYPQRMLSEQVGLGELAQLRR